MNKVQKYVNETVAELQKMTWPTKEELIGSTVITVVFSLVTASFIGVVDWVLGTVIKSIFGGGIQG